MSKGRYGIHGGQYISETLMNELIHLEECYEHYKKDPEFNAELNKLLNEYAGRPSLLYYAGKMTKDLGGAKIYLKREDLNHTGSHKINNALGQALLAKKMGKTRLIAENRCRTARCGYRNGSSLPGDGMRNLHGKRRYQQTGIECLPYGTSGSQGTSRNFRYHDLKGCCQ